MARNIRGVTIVEMMIALAILSIGLLGLCSAIISNMTTIDHNREEVIAMNAIRRQLTLLEMTSFNTVPAGGSTAEVPGVVQAFGNVNFAVPELNGATGRVIMPTTGGGILNETMTAITVQNIDGLGRSESLATLGMPMDINFDNDPNDTAVANTAYQIVPVRIRVQWHSPTSQPGRPHEVVFNTVLGKLK